MKPYPPRATSVQVCRTILISLSFAVLLGGAQSALAQAPESSEDGFNAFQIILQRNIFDPDRKVQLPPSEQRPPPPRQPDPESFTLTGTMLYGDKKMAFFDGSSRDYQGVKDQKQTIADHMIDQVTADGVLLRRDGSDETIDMKVGMQLRRVGDAPWELSSALGGAPSSSRRRSRSAGGRTPPSSGAESSAESGSAGEADAPAADANASASEILKRLIEKRKKEMQQ